MTYIGKNLLWLLNGLVKNKKPPTPHWAKMGLIFPRTPFPSGNSIYSKVKQIASFEK